MSSAGFNTNQVCRKNIAVRHMPAILTPKNPLVKTTRGAASHWKRSHISSLQGDKKSDTHTHIWFSIRRSVRRGLLNAFSSDHCYVRFIATTTVFFLVLYCDLHESCAQVSQAARWVDTRITIQADGRLTTIRE
jgi:hypothetical protein